MFHCKSCLKEYPYKHIIDGKVYRLSKYDRSYCFNCSPPGKCNRKHLYLKHRTEMFCSICKEIKSLDQFRKYKNSHRGPCKKCETKRLLLYATKRKLKFIEYKGGKCMLCGYNRCPAALHFHHRDPSQKKFEISKSRHSSLKVNKQELDKCDLLCANCHWEVEMGFTPEGQNGPAHIDK